MAGEGLFLWIHNHILEIKRYQMFLRFGRHHDNWNFFYWSTDLNSKFGQIGRAATNFN